mmetsp:Transcript_13712/g.20771  ORF Transcript_13712/g.20771 Transcript_13712/m.20771 type:complete len:372 (-) Transcript_13712:35-1150(-)
MLAMSHINPIKSQKMDENKPIKNKTTTTTRKEITPEEMIKTPDTIVEDMEKMKKRFLTFLQKEKKEDMVKPTMDHLGHAGTNETKIVFWHGMGDVSDAGLKRLGELIKKHIPNAYIKSIRIGDSDPTDVYNSYLMPIKKQVQMVCTMLKEDENLKGGFHALGFSQGGQFLRYYVQTCNEPKVKNLITFGAQHQGVFGLPKCPGESSKICEFVREYIINYGAYVSFIQNHIVQAQYWHDPYNMEQDYMKYNIWLPEANNARDQKNDQYKKNLCSLNRFVMVKFTNDSMVQPRESSWFGFYAPTAAEKHVLTNMETSELPIQPLRETRLYKEDWLGLKQMDAEGKLTFMESPGDHLQFTTDWFVHHIVPILKE